MEMQKTDFKLNIPVVGAKKRKTNRRDQIRAETPTDSGFKEPSEESLPVTSSISPTADVEEITNTVGSRRTSNRLKVIKEEFDKLSPAQLKLKMTLERRRLPSSKRVDYAELKRWTPTVMIRSMSQREIGRLTDDWSFIDHIKTLPQPSVVAHRLTTDGEKSWLIDGVWKSAFTNSTCNVFPYERRTSTNY